MSNCIEIIKPFTEELLSLQPEFNGVQIFGGICTAALIHPQTIINYESKEVIAPDDLTLDSVRSDGTRRDIDVFVPSSDPSFIRHIRELLTNDIGDELDPSVFGIKPEESLRKQLEHPLATIALTYVSERYEWDGKKVKSLYPLAVDIDEASLAPWKLIVGDISFNIPNPAMSIINYLCRSVSGLRPKDREKVEKLAKNVFEKSPELRDWAVDGPGQSQVELGLLLRSFTPHKDHPDLLGVNRRILTLPELAEVPHFLQPENFHGERLMMLGATATKAQALSTGESIEFLRTFYQNSVERTSIGDKLVNID